jgi:hypothetical protein
MTCLIKESNEDAHKKLLFCHVILKRWGVVELCDGKHLIQYKKVVVPGKDNNNLA